MDKENQNVNENQNKQGKGSGESSAESGGVVSSGASAESRGGASAASKLMQGATILAIAGVMCKVLGGIFRIPLTNMIGAEGQSYYGAAYPVYQLFYTIATAGFPVAISRMVSERVARNDYINADKSFKIALQTCFGISAIVFAICCFGADQIADRDGAPPLGVGAARLHAHQIRNAADLQFRRILDDDDALRLRDRVRQNVQKRGLAVTRAA